MTKRPGTIYTANKPRWSDQCWALMEIPGPKGLRVVQCGNSIRHGKKTCRHHNQLEEAARKLADDLNAEARRDARTDHNLAPEELPHEA